jgi:Ni/Co efflux regulator RcnB
MRQRRPRRSRRQRKADRLSQQEKTTLTHHLDSKVIQFPGQSGMYGTPHTTDMVDAWRKGGRHPLYWRREDVEKNKEHVLKLVPA